MLEYIPPLFVLVEEKHRQTRLEGYLRTLLCRPFLDGLDWRVINLCVCGYIYIPLPTLERVNNIWCCGVVVCREVDEEDEATPWKEQENWEADQIKKATMKVGSKDKAKQAQQYEFVFEDQIDFIKDLALAGDVVRPCHAPCLPSESSFLAHA